LGNFRKPQILFFLIALLAFSGGYNLFQQPKPAKNVSKDVVLSAMVNDIVGDSTKPSDSGNTHQRSYDSPEGISKVFQKIAEQHLNLSFESFIVRRNNFSSRLIYLQMRVLKI
jgi:hypothetical protein